MRLSGLMMTNALTAVNNERSQPASWPVFCFICISISSPEIPVFTHPPPPPTSFVCSWGRSSFDIEGDWIWRGGRGGHDGENQKRKERQTNTEEEKECLCLLVLLKHQRNCDKLNLNLWLKILCKYPHLQPSTTSHTDYKPNQHLHQQSSASTRHASLLKAQVSAGRGRLQLWFLNSHRKDRPVRVELFYERTQTFSQVLQRCSNQITCSQLQKGTRWFRSGNELNGATWIHVVGDISFKHKLLPHHQTLIYPKLWILIVCMTNEGLASTTNDLCSCFQPLQSSHCDNPRVWS